MADPRLLQALDFILNHSDESSIEAIAEAVVRRRRSLSLFQASGDIINPDQMIKQVSESLNGSTKKIMDGMRASIHETVVRIIHEHAPELNDKQINELCRAWMPGNYSTKAAQNGDLPPDVLLSMIDQFVQFSNGTMPEAVDQGLRGEIGAWPERYWNVFPPVVRQIISDYLKDKMTDKEYKSKILLALGLQ